MYTECIIVHILVNVLLTHFVYLNTKWLGGSKGKHSCKFDKFCQMISCRLLLVYNTPMNFTCLPIKQFETLWSLPISQWNMAYHVNLTFLSLRVMSLIFSCVLELFEFPFLWTSSSYYRKYCSIGIYIYISLSTCIYHFQWQFIY